MLDIAQEQTEAQSPEPSKSAERRRGILKAHQSVALLQKRWPGLLRDDARPLASSCVAEIATAMGWSIQFTRPAVLRWKRSYRYCQAILKHTERVHLDGSPSGEMVDDQARALAQAQLDRKQVPSIAGAPACPATCAEHHTGFASNAGCDRGGSARSRSCPRADETITRGDATCHAAETDAVGQATGSAVIGSSRGHCRAVDDRPRWIVADRQTMVLSTSSTGKSQNSAATIAKADGFHRNGH